MNKNKPIFFTSDWHLGHHNVLKFCDRPFKDINEMREKFIKNYNMDVPEHGVCYFLGDMGMKNSEEIRKTLSRLNGTKILIFGNHDKGYNRMYSLGFDAVLNSASLIIANELVTLSHYPLLGVFREKCKDMKGVLETDNWHKEHKYGNIALQNNGQVHFHGHIHSPNKGRSNKIEGLQYDVGIDANNYRVFRWSQAESFITNLRDKGLLSK